MRSSRVRLPASDPVPILQQRIHTETRVRFCILVLTRETEDQRMKKKDMEIVQMKTTTFQQTIAKETAEAREIQEAITSLSSELDKHAQTRDALKAQIASTQREIDARLAAQRAHAAQMDAQARFNVPELDFWVNNLCLRIEGAGRTDHLKFVYTCVDERDWERDRERDRDREREREAWFELVTDARDYDVRSCRPRLEREKVERVLDRVNETRELAALLKGMRELFVEAMKG